MTAAVDNLLPPGGCSYKITVKLIAFVMFFLYFPGETFYDFFLIDRLNITSTIRNFIQVEWKEFEQGSGLWYNRTVLFVVTPRVIWPERAGRAR
jgi:hypothetical protein